MNPLLITGIFELGKSIIGKLWADPAQQAEAQRKLLEMQLNGELQQAAQEFQMSMAQADTNKLDAQSGSNYRGGWRPFIGWVCGLGFAYQFLIRPLLNAYFIHTTGQSIAPSLEGDTLMSLTFGILGLGGLRSFEKYKKVG